MITSRDCVSTDKMSNSEIVDILGILATLNFVTEYEKGALNAASATLSGDKDGEPVAWLCDAGDGENIQAVTSTYARDTYASAGRIITPLYTSPLASLSVMEWATLHSDMSDAWGEEGGGDAGREAMASAARKWLEGRKDE